VVGFPGLHEGQKGMAVKFDALCEWFFAIAVQDPDGYVEMETLGIVAGLCELRDLNAQRMLERKDCKQFYNETQKEFVGSLIAKLREFLSMGSHECMYAKYHLQRVVRDSQAKDARIAELEALLAASGGCVPSPPKKLKPFVNFEEPVLHAARVADDTTAATGTAAAVEAALGEVDLDLLSSYLSQAQDDDEKVFRHYR